VEGGDEAVRRSDASGGLDGVADQEQDGGGANVAGAEVLEGGTVDVLEGGGGAGDGDDGGGGGYAGVDEVVGEGLEVTAGHVEDEGGVGRQGALPDGLWVGVEGGLVGGVMGGGEDELGGGGPVGEGCLEGGGGGEGGGDAGDDLEGDPGGAERGDLFRSAAEDQRISGLETKDGLARAGGVDHEGVDLGLGDAGLSTPFSDGEDAGGGVSEGEDVVRDEAVGEDEAGGLEEAMGAQGEEVGVAWTGACEVDVPGLGWGVGHLSSLRSGSAEAGGGSERGLVRAWWRAMVREGQAS